MSKYTNRLAECFGEEMRSAPRPTVSGPSSSVLHFLRSQSEQACFHTASTRATACQTSSYRGAKVALEKSAHALSSTRRHLATSSRHQASVDSSLLNLEFLRPYSDRGSSRFAALASRTPPAPFAFPPESVGSSRYASTDTRPLWRRPWKAKMHNEASAALPSFLDDTGSTSFGRRKKTKGVNELKLRCTEFDEVGNVTFMDGEFKKSELIAKVCPINLMSERRHRH